MLKLFNIASLRSLLSGCLLVSFSTALLSLLIGCSHDTAEQLSEEDLVRVNFQVLAHSDADGLLPGESDLNSLRILVYDASDNIEVNRLLKKGVEFDVSGQDYAIDCTLTLASGKKTFCLVGNEGSQSGVLSEGPLTVSSASLLEKGRWDAVDRPVVGGLIPSTCIYRVNNLSASGVLDFKMTRSVGCVKLDLHKALGLRDSVVCLTSVRVLNAATESRMFSGSSSFSPGTTNLPAQTVFSPTDVVPERGAGIDPVSMTPVYLYEYSPVSEAGATSLKISFTVNDDPKSVTLPLPIGEDSDGNWVYGVKRNTIASFDLTIDKKDIIVEYTVESWGEVEEYDRELGSDDSNWWYADWIEVTDYSHTLEGHP